MLRFREDPTTMPIDCRCGRVFRHNGGLHLACPYFILAKTPEHAVLVSLDTGNFWVAPKPVQGYHLSRKEWADVTGGDQNDFIPVDVTITEEHK